MQPAFCKKYTVPKMRFLCDEMMAEVGRWLRAAGYDTKILDPATSDQEIFECAKKEKRLLITRDRHFLGMNDPDKLVIYLSCNSTDECIAELSSKLKINWLLNPFSRCVICNSELVVADPAKVVEKVSPDIRSRIEQFWYCPSCQKVYWQASHTDHMLKRLRFWQQSNSDH